MEIYSERLNAHIETLNLLDDGEVLAKNSDWQYRNGKLLTGVLVSPIPGWDGEKGSCSNMGHILKASGLNSCRPELQVYRMCCQFGSRILQLVPGPGAWSHECEYILHRLHIYHCLFGNGRYCGCYKMIAITKHLYRQLDGDDNTRLNFPPRYRAAMVYGNRGIPSRHELRHKLWIINPRVDVSRSKTRVTRYRAATQVSRVSATVAS